MIAEGYKLTDLFALDCLNEYIYEDILGGVKIVGYCGTREFLIIPEQLDGKPVLEIGRRGMLDIHRTISYIQIPKTVKKIDLAAVNSSGLRVKNWATIFSISEENEYYSYDEETGILYNRDRTIIYYCFNTTLESYEMPNTVVVVEEEAFSLCRLLKLENITFSTSLKMIGKRAFCESKGEVTLVEGIEELGYMAFQNGNVVVPASVTSLHGAPALSYKISPNNNHFIIVNSFVLDKNKSKIYDYIGKEEMIIIPDSVTVIGEYSFYHLKKIRKLRLGASVKEIQYKAFGKAEIKTLRIPASVEKIDDEAFYFYKCNSVIVDKANTHFYTDKIGLLRIVDEETQELISCYKSNIVEYIVPEKVKKIGKKAFCYASDLINLQLPKGLTSFDEACLSEVSWSMMKHCKVNQLKLPEMLSSLKYEAGERIREIHYFVAKGNTTFFWENHVFYQKIDTGYIALFTDYLQKEVVLKDGTVEIAESAFKGNFVDELKSVVLPSTVKRIGKNAFLNSGLEELYMQEGVEVIEANAFCNCRLTNFLLPASIKSFDSSSIDNNPIEKIIVEENNLYYTSVDGILYNKDMTKLIRFPEKKKVKKFVVPSTVIDIGKAFYNCRELQVVVLSDKIKHLWRNALSGCLIKKIYLNSDLIYIDVAFNIALAVGSNNVEIYGSSTCGLAEHILQRGFSRNIKYIPYGMEEICYNSSDFYVVPYKKGVAIISYCGQEKYVKVPEQIGGYPVLLVGPDAFARSEIVSVQFPDSITTIGDNAFRDCKSLQTVMLPAKLKEVSSGMFMGNESLTQVDIPEGVECIKMWAFLECPSLIKLTVPASVKEISQWSFYTDMRFPPDIITNPNTLYEVQRGSYAETFFKTYNVEHHQMDSLNIVYKGEWKEETEQVFEGLDYKIIEGKTVTVSLKQDSYKRMILEKETIIPETMWGFPVTKLVGMKNIRDSLEVLTLPATLTEIEGLSSSSWGNKGCFKKLIVAEDNPVFWSDGVALYSKDKTRVIHFFSYEVENYKVNEHTKVIEEGAFRNFKMLKKVILHKNIEEIKEEAFVGCSFLEEIQEIEMVSKVAMSAITGIPYYNKAPYVIIGTVLYRCNIRSERQIVIPEGVTEIASKAFAILELEDNDSLEEVVIPKSVTKFGESVFSGRTYLNSITIPEGIKELPSHFLERCMSISAIYLPKTVEQVSPLAFPRYDSYLASNLKLVSIFEKILVAPDNKAYCSVDGILYSKDMSTLIAVPTAYKGTIITLPETVTTIGAFAFSHNQLVKQVILPQSLKKIESYAFESCLKLETINLENVEFIGTYAFFGCERLKEVTISCDTIETSTFEECGMLEKIFIRNVKTIKEDAFKHCYALKSIDFPDSLETIEDNAFRKTGLQVAILPKTIKSFGYGVFCGVKEIVVYDSICDTKVGCLGVDIRKYDEEVGIISYNSHNHVIIVKSAETEEVKYKVWMNMDSSYNVSFLAFAWDAHATFKFALLDKFFSAIKGIEEKSVIAMNRLQYPVDLKESKKESYIKYLERNANILIQNCIDREDMEKMLFLQNLGIIKRNNIDSMIDYAAKVKAVQFSTHLMGYKTNELGLDAFPEMKIKMVSEWQLSKTMSGKLGRYKGSDVEVVFPTEVRGRKISGIANTTSKVPDNYKQITSIIIPEGYTTIGDYAFYDCENLEKVILPSTLKTIGKMAFANCFKLSEIVLPDSVTMLGEKAFYCCKTLKHVTFSKGLSIIPKYAFAISELEEIDLPENITVLQEECFFRCPLKKVVVRCEKLTSYGMYFRDSSTIYYCREGAMDNIYVANRKQIRLLEENSIE